METIIKAIEVSAEISIRDVECDCRFLIQGEMAKIDVDNN
jgi:hypothetical protein